MSQRNLLGGDFDEEEAVCEVMSSKNDKPVALKVLALYTWCTDPLFGMHLSGLPRLPALDSFGFCGRSPVQVKIISVRHLPKMDSGFAGFGGKCDPFVELKSEGIYKRDHDEVC